MKTVVRRECSPRSGYCSRPHPQQLSGGHHVLPVLLLHQQRLGHSLDGDAQPRRCPVARRGVHHGDQQLGMAAARHRAAARCARRRPMAATNKCLAQSNKSRTGGKATNRHYRATR